MLVPVRLILLILPFAAGIDCPDGWMGHGDSCYLFIPKKQPWAAASLACASKGAVLAKIETEEEEHFIRAFLKTFDALGADMNTWNGGNDLNNEGVWEWSPSGKQMTYTDWGDRQPGGSTRENCLEMFQRRDFAWDDAPCYYNNSAMCEKKMKTALTLIG